MLDLLELLVVRDLLVQVDLRDHGDHLVQEVQTAQLALLAGTDRLV